MSIVSSVTDGGALTTNGAASGRRVDKSLAWYLRSLADHDTHRGWLGGDGSVLALCGASFIPKLTLRVVGEPPGQLVDGPPELALPPVPEQVCLECRREASSW